MILGALALGACVVTPGQAGEPQVVKYRFKNRTGFKCSVHINRAAFADLTDLAPGEERTFEVTFERGGQMASRIDVAIYPGGHGKSQHARIAVVDNRVNAVITYRRTGPRAWDGELSIAEGR